MKIQIIRSKSEDDSSKTGVGIYADLIEELITDTGNETDVIPFEITIRKGIWYALRSGAIDPLGKILAGRKDADIVHAVFEYCSVYFPFTRAKRVVTFHHVVGKDEKNSKKWFLTWRLAAWIAIVFADKIVAVSPQTKEEILHKYNVAPEKVEVVIHVPKGLRVIDSVEKEHIIGCMGTINKRKNFSAAIRVFASVSTDCELRDYRMIICGKGPMKESLLEQIRFTGLEGKVSFIQDITKDEMALFYNKCSVILNTSSHEGLGLATVEAQMCGTPVLYFEDADIPKEVMVAAVSCINEEDMSEKAKKILKDQTRMEELIGEGLEFTNTLGNDFREKTLAIYNSLLDSSR
ncbi:MAG: glycosyltransferase [Candidatus Methanoplasma sp.]|jgi:glycosyltransferase involved in cell wall biosynthesis|nr:glycosyltransferase [Candidatus Methanoplasma sp.]